jgi:ADP-ribosylglycohydrolase
VDRERARASLLGCAIGDALGDQLANPADALARRLPSPPWRWTDDTEMACSVWHVLDTVGHLDPDVLADSFVRHYDVDRGYGAGATKLLHDARRGANLRVLAAQAFGGTGSWGNGAAMRVAPLGAWFAGDPVRAAAEAAASARVTHTHQEGVAGAVATAVAAAQTAAQTADLRSIRAHVQPGLVHDGITKAAAMQDATAAEVAAEVGAGGQISAPDTVPLALWIATRHATDYEEAVWTAASVAEDVDTVCAIVGGIVAARVGEQGIPARWRQSVEPLPDWV